MNININRRYNEMDLNLMQTIEIYRVWVEAGPDVIIGHYLYKEKAEKIKQERENSIYFDYIDTIKIDTEK